MNVPPPDDTGIVGMDPALWELYESGAPDEEVSVIMRLAKGAPPPPNVRIVASFGEIFTARLRRSEIPETRKAVGMISLKAGRPVTEPKGPDDEIFSHDTIERSAPFEDCPPGGSAEETADRPRQAPAPQLQETGRGVVVGICDWGFDFTHPNFRNADGSTRIEALWDQRGSGDPLEPAPYGYGRVLTRDAINAALAEPDPGAALGYAASSVDLDDRGTHGTHVADIVCGNRREPGSEVGLASGSDLVFVHLAAPQLDELGNLGDSVGLLEGLDFIRRQAAGRPCVLHLSAGKTGGDHTGETPLERAVDAMLLDPGIALVQSVGNYADTAMHTHARIGPDSEHVLNWITPENDRTPNELEVWYSGEDVFEASLIAPDGRQFRAPLDTRVRLRGDFGTWGNFYHRLRDPNNGQNHIDIFLYRGAPSGHWRVVLRGRDVVDGRLHAWIERDASGRYQSRFLRTQATSRFTTNTICNCYRAIAVGAYDGTRPDRPPTRFSSRGPTADGRQKPECAAPGYRIRAARSLPRRGWRPNESRLCVKSGTSMAAPAVSGTVALMYEAAGRLLTIYEVRRALIGTLDPHPGPPGRTSTRIGYGYLNTSAAVAAARRLRVDGATAAVPAAAAAEEEGWAPVRIEDAAAGAAIDGDDGETDVGIDVEDVEQAESQPVDGPEWEGLETTADDADDDEPLEDEAEEGSAEDEAVEEIAAPFLWEEIQDALDAAEFEGAP